jgi:glycosyltransferase involved in cell wall biosynthesis
MNIVHVIEPLAGGMVTFMKSLAENMPADKHIIIHGSREHVVPLGEVKKQFSSFGVRFIPWRSARRNPGLSKDTAAFAELYTILRRLRNHQLIDVVHLHCSKAGFIGRIVCRILGLRDVVLYTPNGSPFASGNSKLANFMYKQLERLASIFGGKVVCCSPSEQKAYMDAGIHAITINNGINYQKLIKHPKLHKKPGTFNIITVGRIVDQKNPALFNAIASYFEEFPQIQFTWVGEGGDREILTAGNIRITGWLPEQQVHRLIAAADVYLSTARYEGLPFAVLEALALKKPMLLSDCTGNSDLINGLNGNTFQDEKDAITKILQFYNNSSMLEIMGEHSASFCKINFNLADTFRRYRRLYNEATLYGKITYSSTQKLANGTNG